MSEEMIIHKIKRLYNRGLNCIYSQNKLAWAQCVKNAVQGKYKGEDCEAAVLAMEALDAGKCPKEAYDVSFGRKKYSEGCIMKAVVIAAQFSKKGVEFYCWVAGCHDARVLTANEEKFISKIVRQNECFKKQDESTKIAE